MDKTEKLAEKRRLMEKMLRELQDISNSQTSLLKKIAQLEADNINLSNSLLDKRLPDIHEKIDSCVTEANMIQTEFGEVLNKFIEDNKLNEIPAATT
jgi:DNA repair ATPase RecN